MPSKGIKTSFSFSHLDVSFNLIFMFVAMVFCTAKRTNVLHYKKNMDENLNTKLARIILQNITTIVISMPNISKVMIEFLTWN